MYGMNFHAVGARRHSKIRVAPLRSSGLTAVKTRVLPMWTVWAAGTAAVRRRGPIARQMQFRQNGFLRPAKFVGYLARRVWNGRFGTGSPESFRWPEQTQVWRAAHLQKRTARGWPTWRNWQTRWTQNPVTARSWGFDPLRRHQQTPLKTDAAARGRPNFFRTIPPLLRWEIIAHAGCLVPRF